MSRRFYARSRHAVHQLTVHLVFVLKYRNGEKSPFVRENKWEKLFSEISADPRFDAELVSFGADGDHVHLVVRYPPRIALSRLVQQLKGESSRRYNAWLLAQGKEATFRWSPSYFAKSVGSLSLATTVRYAWQEKGPNPKRRRIPTNAAAISSAP